MKLHQHLLDRHFNPNLYCNIALDDENHILTIYPVFIKSPMTYFDIIKTRNETLKRST